MAVKNREERFADPQIVPVAETVAYTANRADLFRAVVKQLILSNVHATLAAGVGVSIKPGGGVGATATRIVPDGLTIAPGETQIFDLSQVLYAGDTISWKASLADAVVGTISGIERVGTGG